METKGFVIPLGWIHARFGTRAIGVYGQPGVETLIEYETESDLISAWNEEYDGTVLQDLFPLENYRIIDRPHDLESLLLINSILEQ